jgi:hypothetical protein
VIRPIPDRARQLAAELERPFAQDADSAWRLDDAHERTRRANDWLWWGLHPDGMATDDAALVCRLLDALKHDPDARRQLRDLLEVDAGAATTRPAVYTLAIESIGRWRPTYDEHQAIRRAIVEAGMHLFEPSTDDVPDRADVREALLSTTMVESVESPVRDLIRGAP